jgi:hypothetical protein
MDVSGSFTATGQSEPLLVQEKVPFNISLWGTFDSTVRLERSFPPYDTWLPLTAAGQALYVWTTAASEMAAEPEGGVKYRLNCTNHASGTVNYRISQGGVRFG